MDVLDHLAVALGFATLAGINLYLTVFVTGLAVKFNWVVLAERHAELSVLGEWPVIGVAGALLLVEVFADKIPWVDSVWDGFQSLIRPVGGGLLAVSALGATQPEYDVIIALVAGSATLVSHGFKAGTRLMVNTSPEPVSNVVVSAAEDGAVLAGLALMAVEPKLLGAICVVVIVAGLFLLPKLIRRFTGLVWLARHALRSGEATFDTVNLGPDEFAALRERAGKFDALWSVPVMTSRVKGLRKAKSWMRGQLVALNGEGEHRRLFFVGRRFGHDFAAEIPGGKLRVAHENGLLSEKLMIYDEEGTFQAGFRLPRSRGQVAERISEVVRMLVPGKALETA